MCACTTGWSFAFKETELHQSSGMSEGIQGPSLWGSTSLTPETESASVWLMQGSLLHEFQCESKLAASSSFPPHEFCMMYVARIGLSWQFFGVILETNLLTSKGSQKTSQLVDCPGMKTAQSPCLLSQVVWTVRVPPRLDLAVFRDSHAGQSWMKHGPRTAPIRFDQKPGQPWSPSPSGPSSWLSENDSSCMQGINCMSHVICSRSRMPITQGDVAIRSLELAR